MMGFGFRGVSFIGFYRGLRGPHKVLDVFGLWGISGRNKLEVFVA